jgi:hypothetical protein
MNNPYINTLEKSRLEMMMAYSKPIRFKYTFTDSRNRFIYGWLESFLLNFPANQHADEWFLYYLSETPGAIERAGGQDYVRDIFRGVGSQAW